MNDSSSHWMHDLNTLREEERVAERKHLAEQLLESRRQYTPPTLPGSSVKANVSNSLLRLSTRFVARSGSPYGLAAATSAMKHAVGAAATGFRQQTPSQVPSLAKVGQGASLVQSTATHRGGLLSMLRKRSRTATPLEASSRAGDQAAEAFALARTENIGPLIGRQVVVEAIKRRLRKLGVLSAARKAAVPANQAVLARVGDMMRQGDAGKKARACASRHCTPHLVDYGRLLPGKWLTDPAVIFGALVAADRNAMQLEELARRVDGTWYAPPLLRPRHTARDSSGSSSADVPAARRTAGADDAQSTPAAAAMCGDPGREQGASKVPEGAATEYSESTTGAGAARWKPRDAYQQQQQQHQQPLPQPSEAAMADARRRGGAFVFRSFFMTALTGGRNGYDYSRVQRWTKATDVFALRRVVFPINQADTHWVCAVLDMQARTVCFLDSLGGSDGGVRDVLIRWACDEWHDKKVAKDTTGTVMPMEASQWKKMSYRWAGSLPLPRDTPASRLKLHYRSDPSYTSESNGSGTPAAAAVAAGSSGHGGNGPVPAGSSSSSSSLLSLAGGAVGSEGRRVTAGRSSSNTRDNPGNESALLLRRRGRVRAPLIEREFASAVARESVARQGAVGSKEAPREVHGTAMSRRATRRSYEQTGSRLRSVALPRQLNGCDCGVFVTGFVHALCDVWAYADPERDLLGPWEQVLEASRERVPPVLWGFGQADASRSMRLGLGAGMLLGYMP